MEELTALPGAARKTANVVLGTAFGIADGVVVDTHVGRIARRLGLTREENPDKVERDLRSIYPEARWAKGHQLFVWHGRRVCKALAPACSTCPVEELCPKRGVAKGIRR
jgi:endonuclease-3